MFELNSVFENKYLGEWLLLLLAGWSSGISIYLTLGLLGLGGYLGGFPLPGELQVLANPLVFSIAFIIFAIEFIADKIPFVDSLWDSVHTLIRPIGALALGYLAGSEHGPIAQSVYAVFMAGLTLQTHTAKAASRLAINTSPDPFSNIAASIIEQSVVIGMYWFFIKHPILASLAILALLALSFFLIRLLWKFVKKIFRFFRAAPSQQTG